LGKAISKEKKRKGKKKRKLLGYRKSYPKTLRKSTRGLGGKKKKEKKNSRELSAGQGKGG